MCGIAGVLPRKGAANRQTDGRIIAEMLQSMEHRGPDDQGYVVLQENTLRGRVWHDTGTLTHPVLLHRRLSVLDLSEAGQQPMASKDGRYQIVMNGEVYNYLELRDELARLGHNFTTQTDTEVLLAAYAEWGSAALNKLVGMFAFAIADLQRRTLFLARDFFGIKPLYYVHTPYGFAFASQIKTLLLLPWVNREADPERVYLYLRYGLTDYGSGTMYRSIKQLEAAHYMELPLGPTDSDGGSAPLQVRYWRVDLSVRSSLPFSEASQELRRLFLNSVQLHLRSDVPFGTALSGGIDSSAIVAAMRNVGGPGLEIHTFSYIADDPGLSEDKWVQLAGESANAHIHKTGLPARQIAADLEQLIASQDEPVSNTSMYAQRCVFRLVRHKGIKMVLDGQGADEILGGYRYSLGARMVGMLQRGEILGALRFARAASRLPGSSTLWVLLNTVDYLLPRNLQAPLRRAVGRDLVPTWINTAWVGANRVDSSPLNYGHKENTFKEHLHQILIHTSLPHLLRYEDRNSMTFSVESRVPFLTPEIVQFLFSLPDSYLVTENATTKAVFRSAMKGMVPEQILDRRDKIGFATPERDILVKASPWVEGVIQGEFARTLPVLDVEQVNSAWQNMIKGAAPFSFSAWRWVNLIEWSRLNDVRYT